MVRNRVTKNGTGMRTLTKGFTGGRFSWKIFVPTKPNHGNPTPYGPLSTYSLGTVNPHEFGLENA
jgi:hypothetical protein